MAFVTLYYRRKDNTEDPEPPVIVESISIPIGPTTTGEDMKEVVKEDMKPPVICIQFPPFLLTYYFSATVGNTTSCLNSKDRTQFFSAVFCRAVD
jgi:hypothetical protein